MGWIWPACFDKGHGWDNVPAALSYSPPKNQSSLENLCFFCWCRLSLFTWVVLEEHGISEMAKDFVWLLHQGWNILGLNLLQMSPSHPKWFIRPTLENMISDISWLYGLYFLDAQIAHELFEMPIDEKRMTAPNVVLMENGFKSFNPFQCQERNESLLSVRDTIFALDHRARISQHWTGALRQLWLLWSLENCRHQWLRARLGLWTKVVDCSAGNGRTAAIRCD